MAILDRIRDRNGITIELSDLADQARDHAPNGNGIDPGAFAGDAVDGLSGAARDASDTALGVVKDASETVSGTVKDASDAARERVESLAELIRDVIHEWSKARSDRRVEARLDEIAQRLRAAVPASTFRNAVTRLERELPDTDKDRYDRAYERGRVQTRAIYIAGGLAIGIGAGIAAAILLDPQRGKERRDQIARFKNRVASQAAERSRGLADRSRDLQSRAKSMAEQRGIGRSTTTAATDAAAIADREMVPVMPTGTETVTDPSSIVLEPPPAVGGDIEPTPSVIAEPSTADGTGDRAVTGSHG